MKAQVVKVTISESRGAMLILLLSTLSENELVLYLKTLGGGGGEYNFVDITTDIS